MKTHRASNHDTPKTLSPEAPPSPPVCAEDSATVKFHGSHREVDDPDIRGLLADSLTAKKEGGHTCCSVMSGRTSNTTAGLHSRQSRSASYATVCV